MPPKTFGENGSFGVWTIGSHGLYTDLTAPKSLWRTEPLSGNLTKHLPKPRVFHWFSQMLNVYLLTIIYLHLGSLRVNVGKYTTIHWASGFWKTPKKFPMEKIRTPSNLVVYAPMPSRTCPTLEIHHQKLRRCAQHTSILPPRRPPCHTSLLLMWMFFRGFQKVNVFWKHGKNLKGQPLL